MKELQDFWKKVDAKNPYGNPDEADVSLWYAETRLADAHHRVDAYYKTLNPLVEYMHANITLETIDEPRFDDFNAFLSEVHKRGTDNAWYKKYWRSVVDRLKAEQEAIGKANKDEDIALTQPLKDRRRLLA